MTSDVKELRFLQLNNRVESINSTLRFCLPIKLSADLESEEDSFQLKITEKDGDINNTFTRTHEGMMSILDGIVTGIMLGMKDFYYIRKGKRDVI